MIQVFIPWAVGLVMGVALGLAWASDKRKQNKK